jgi:hypothetical protein
MCSLLSQHRRLVLLVACGLVSLVAGLALKSGPPLARADEDSELAEASRILRGFQISPVELDLSGKNRALVGLGSYIVNARGACNDCHTQPAFAPGGNPFLGEPEVINTDRYLAGGRAFGAAISRNLTPDPETGLPAGLTLREFVLVIRTGVDLDNRLPHTPSEENDLLQTMPWPVFRNMTDQDLAAIYEYLRSIPSVP